MSFQEAKIVKLRDGTGLTIHIITIPTLSTRKVDDLPLVVNQLIEAGVSSFRLLFDFLVLIATIENWVLWQIAKPWWGILRHSDLLNHLLVELRHRVYYQRSTELGRGLLIYGLRRHHMNRSKRQRNIKLGRSLLIGDLKRNRRTRRSRHLSRRNSGSNVSVWHRNSRDNHLRSNKRIGRVESRVRRRSSRIDTGVNLFGVSLPSRKEVCNRRLWRRIDILHLLLLVEFIDLMTFCAWAIVQTNGLQLNLCLHSSYFLMHKRNWLIDWSTPSVICDWHEVTLHISLPTVHKLTEDLDELLWLNWYCHTLKTVDLLDRLGSVDLTQVHIHGDTSSNRPELELLLDGALGCHLFQIHQGVELAILEECLEEFSLDLTDLMLRHPPYKCQTTKTYLCLFWMNCSQEGWCRVLHFGDLEASL